MWNHIELFIRLRALNSTTIFVFSEVSVEFELFKSLLLGCLLQFFGHHMTVFTNVESHLLLFLFRPELLSNSGDHRLFEKDFRCNRFFVLDRFRNLVISESHGPVEVRLGDVTLTEEMPELSNVAVHETF